MFHRMISVFLCSCLLAVNIPQISYAQNMNVQPVSDMEYFAHQGDSIAFLGEGEEENAEEGEPELLDDEEDPNESEDNDPVDPAPDPVEPTPDPVEPTPDPVEPTPDPDPTPDPVDPAPDPV